jgi:sporulation protein YlmC with PRC-barrel domain
MDRAPLVWASHRTPETEEEIMPELLDDLIGCSVYDHDGDKIGKVKQIYIQDNTGAPTWVAVSTGFFSEDTLVPLAGARHRPESHTLQVQVVKEAVKSAPHLDHNGRISAKDERELFHHYHIDPNRAGWDTYGRQVVGQRDSAERRPDDDSMVRSEERLYIGTEQHEADTAGLHKYGVTKDEVKDSWTVSDTVRKERDDAEGVDTEIPQERR